MNRRNNAGAAIVNEEPQARNRSISCLKGYLGINTGRIRIFSFSRISKKQRDVIANGISIVGAAAESEVVKKNHSNGFR